MNKGYIKLHRQLQDNPLWSSETFTKGQAWVDLLLLAGYEENKVIVKGKEHKAQRGELITSLSFLANRWKWSTTKVRKFLEYLEHTGSIEKTSKAYYTQVKIKQYAKFQDTIENTKENTMQTQYLQGLSGNQEHDPNTIKNTIENTMQTQCLQGVTQNENTIKDTIKNTKIKEIYKKNSVCVENQPEPPIGKMLLSDEQYNQLVSEHGESKVKRVIAKAENYYHSVNESILDPLKVFKKFAASDKGEPKQENQARTPSQRKPIQNSFNNFKQRDYDMDELERKLIGH